MSDEMIKTGPDGRKYLKDFYPDFREGYIQSIVHSGAGNHWEMVITCVFDGVPEEYKTCTEDKELSEIFYEALKGGVNTGEYGLIATRASRNGGARLISFKDFHIAKALQDCLSERCKAMRPEFKKWSS